MIEFLNTFIGQLKTLEYILSLELVRGRHKSRMYDLAVLTRAKVSLACLHSQLTFLRILGSHVLAPVKTEKEMPVISDYSFHMDTFKMLHDSLSQTLQNDKEIEAHFQSRVFLAKYLSEPPYHRMVLSLFEQVLMDEVESWISLVPCEKLNLTETYFELVRLTDDQQKRFVVACFSFPQRLASLRGTNANDNESIEAMLETIKWGGE